MKLRFALLPVLALAALVAVVPQAQAHEDEDGYTVIFDAEHGDDWVQAGPGEFAIEDGVATPSGGMGLWWYSGQEYGDFVLSLEFNMDNIDANSGVFLRFPDPEGDPWVAVHEGFEVQIAGNEEGSAHATGAIYDKQAATSIPLNEPGEWNTYEIKCVGNMIYVTLNGELVNEWEFEGTPVGYIGIQNHDDNSIVHYRNIRVMSLEDKEPQHSRCRWKIKKPASSRFAPPAKRSAPLAIRSRAGFFHGGTLRPGKQKTSSRNRESILWAARTQRTSVKGC